MYFLRMSFLIERCSHNHSSYFFPLVMYVAAQNLQSQRFSVNYTTVQVGPNKKSMRTRLRKRLFSSSNLQQCSFACCCCANSYTRTHARTLLLPPTGVTSGGLAWSLQQAVNYGWPTLVR